MKKVTKIFMVLMLAVTLAACAGTGTREERAAKGLLVGQETIVSIAVSADQLCTAGVLNQSQCDEISNLYETAKVAYDLAEASLSTALQSDSDDSWQRYEAFHANFQQLYADLLALAVKLGVEYEEVN